MRVTLIGIAGLLAAFGTWAAADVVVTTDDRVLAGRVEVVTADDGTPVRLRVHTAAGPVEVPAAAVAHRVADPVELKPVFRARRDAIGEARAATAAALVALGRWGRAAGLDLEARACFDDVVAVAPDHPEARAALGHVRHQGRWMTEGEAMRAKGFVLYDGRWMLPAERALYERRRAADAPAATVQVRRREYAGLAAGLVRGDAELAGRFAAIGAEDQLRVLLAGLSHADAAVRAAVAGRLAAHRDLRAVRALTWQAVRDDDAAVRTAAVAALKQLDYDRTPLFLGSALRATDEQLRVRAAESLAQFGDNPLAPRVLADRWIEGWGGGPRVNIMIGSAVAYIRDFEVEVAQSAAIADPIVGVIHEAAVLDYQVQGMRQAMSGTESRAYRRGLEQLVGKDLGPDPTPWAEYLNGVRREAR